MNRSITPVHTSSNGSTSIKSLKAEELDYDFTFITQQLGFVEENRHCCGAKARIAISTTVAGTK